MTAVGNAGVRARLAWYWRRAQRKPWHLTYFQSPLGFCSAVLDPRPPWRKPGAEFPGSWRELGAIDNEIPEAFRRRTPQ